MNNVPSVIWRISSHGLRATTYSEQALLPFSKGLYARINRNPTYTLAVQRLYQSASLAHRWLQCTGAGSGIGARALEPAQELRNDLLSTVLKRRGFASNKKAPGHTRGRPIQPKPLTRAVKDKIVKDTVPEPDREKVRNLTKPELANILGPSMTLEVGNRLLQTLQGLRVAGRLDEDITAPGVDEVTVAKALIWLRRNYPYDEDAAIMRRIEQEDDSTDAQSVADGVRMGLYKPQENTETVKHGTSGLDTIREHYEKKLDKKLEQKQAHEIQNASPDSAMIQQPKGRAVLARRSESAEWVKRYKEKAQLEGLNFTKANWGRKLLRLFPSTCFAIGVLWFCVLLAQNYVPPPRQARLFPDMPPAAATIIAIVVLNATAFVLWRIPPMWRFMNKFFLIVPARPRVWSLLGNTFSHQSPAHFIGNMAVLWFVGTKLHDDIGRGNFLAIYLATGVFASYFSLCRFVLTNNLVTTSLGASGAITGVIAAWCSIHAGEQFKIRFLPPELGPVFSLNLLLALLVAGEVMGIVRGYKRLDHWAHIGGYTSGFLGAQALKYRSRKRREEQSSTAVSIGKQTGPIVQA
ncbi:hypothetical protein MMC13_007299 [Lambiella insularis]|nr:hypothetical protein [Lambiella insularis]